VTSPRDKIVLEAMKMVLEPIFEPTFSDFSHGFRYNRSCHTALKLIYRMFAGVNWFIKGDISKCFDSLDHKILVDKIRSRVNDQGFLDLLYKSLNVGYVYNNSLFHNELGSRQESMLSPLLCNIYMNSFDKW
jgi:retron-type reverse transcriptase